MTTSPAQELLAKAMIECGMSTGHGDTMEDLIAELVLNIKELRASPADDGRELLIWLHGQVTCCLPDGVMTTNPQRFADNWISAFRQQDKQS